MAPCSTVETATLRPLFAGLPIAVLGALLAAPRAWGNPLEFRLPPAALPGMAQNAATLPPAALPADGLLSACGDISRPGRYRLSGDLIANPGQSCLRIHDTANVQLDCAHHAILSNGAPFAVSIERVKHFSVEACEMRDVATIGLHLADVSDGLIHRSLLHGMNVNSPESGEASELAILDNTFTEYYQQYRTHDSRIAHNRFRLPEDTGGAAAVLLDHGWHNEVAGNEIDGGWAFASKPATGPRDGLVLSFEADTRVLNNQIANNWDCGIETVGRLERMVLSGNSIRNSGLCGIGGWRWSSWRGNQVAGNRFDRVGTMFLFGRQYGLQKAEDYAYFEDNLFTGNRAGSFATEDPGAYAADCGFGAVAGPDRFGRTLAPSQLLVRNNVFRQNDFGLALRAPRLSSRSLAVDGGQNICQESTDPSYPLACGRRAETPATVSLPAVPTAEPRVYPNPWRARRDAGRPIAFDSLPAGATVKIFTLAGRWVRTLGTADGKAEWDLRDESGETAASGVYFFLATGPAGEKHAGRFALIR
jgi:hypothetical protein